MTHSVLSHFYEGLVAFGPNMEIQPALSESWENPTDRVWRFQLRAGVRFHDGAALSASDVVASLERARRPPSPLAYHLGSVVEVRAADPGIVEIRTSATDPDLPAHLVFVAIVPASAPAEEISRPVGTGPFRLVSGGPRHPLVALRFEGHWAKARSAFAKIELLGLADGRQRANAVREGRADVVAQFPPENWVSAAGQIGVRQLARRSLSTLMLGFDLRPSSPFSDARLREAVSLAVDREALIDRGLGGLGEPVDQVVPPEVVGYARGLAPASRDRARALALLREGRADSPTPAVLRVSTTLEPAARELVRQLGDLGLAVRLEILEQNEFFARWVDDPAPLTLFAYSAATGEALSTFSPLLHSRNGAHGVHNLFSYADTEMDRVIERAAGMGLTPRQPLLERAAAIQRRDLPVLPLAQRIELYALRDDLEWSPRLDRYVRAQDFRPRSRR